MAAGGSDTETELRKLLKEEHERRSEFYDRLQTLMWKRQKEEREQMTGGEDATLTELVHRLLKVDDDSSSLLQQCGLPGNQDSVEQLAVVSRRRKATGARPASGGDRDSGLPPTPNVSADMDAAKRHATFVTPRDAIDETLTAFPETEANNDDDDDYSAMDKAVHHPEVSQQLPQDPQEHTDESSDAESSSSPPASPPVVDVETLDVEKL